MNKNVFQDLSDHFDAICEELKSEARQAKTLKNSASIGNEREDVFLRFLDRHIPSVCRTFRGGYVFNLNGDRSAQTDIIVTSGMCPKFTMGAGNLAIAPIEGVIGIVEVKSYLTKQDLTKALLALQKLPAIGKRNMSPLYKPPKNTEWDMPYKLIFAYDGIRAEVAKRTVDKFYSNHRDTPQAQRPSLILVLGKYAIRRLYPDGIYEKLSGKLIDKAALVATLAELQANLFTASQTIVPYSEYIPRIQGLSAEE